MRSKLQRTKRNFEAFYYLTIDHKDAANVVQNVLLKTGRYTMDKRKLSSVYLRLTNHYFLSDTWRVQDQNPIYIPDFVELDIFHIPH